MYRGLLCTCIGYSIGYRKDCKSKEGLDTQYWKLRQTDDFIPLYINDCTDLIGLITWNQLSDLNSCS
jgi:hypothetical protein